MWLWLVCTSLGSAKRRRVQLCQRSSDFKGNECATGEMSVVPLVLIFLSQFVAGIGVLLFFSLGGPYLDDNIKKTQSPMLFGNWVINNTIYGYHLI